FVPPGDHLALADDEVDGRPAIPRRVELLAAPPDHAGVVHGDGLAGGTPGPVPLMSPWDTSVVGAVTPCGMVMVGLPSAASATVGSPATGATASPVAFW